MNATRRLIAVMALIAPMAAVQGHHSLDGEFNQKDVVVLKGSISKVDWINPHVFFTVDVPDAGASSRNGGPKPCPWEC